MIQELNRNSSFEDKLERFPELEPLRDAPFGDVEAEISRRMMIRDLQGMVAAGVTRVLTEGMASTVDAVSGAIILAPAPLLGRAGNIIANVDRVLTIKDLAGKLFGGPEVRIGCQARSGCVAQILRE